MANSVHPVQTILVFASILDSSVMLGNYLQQTTSVGNIFRCIFLGALRVKHLIHHCLLSESIYKFYSVCLA